MEKCISTVQDNKELLTWAKIVKDAEVQPEHAQKEFKVLLGDYNAPTMEEQTTILT